MSWDARCSDLAHHFLDGVKGATDQDIRDLADVFQMAAEDACKEVELRGANEHKD